MFIKKFREPIGLSQELWISGRVTRGPTLGQPASSPLARGPNGVADAHLGQSRENRHLNNLPRPPSSPVRALTPVQFADMFHNLQVSFVERPSGVTRTVTVNVHIYNNNGIAECRADMNEKAILVAAVKREFKRSGGLTFDVEQDHKYQIARCFYGKGNPDEFRVTLTHALRYNRSTLAGLQNYCDRRAKLGVDCSGFVNTYFERIGRISTHQHINEYERGTLRSSLDEIQDLDVLVWQGGPSRHIAVIDHVIVGSNPLKMVVVESSKSKHGLATSEYTVLDVKKGIFTVNRGGGSNGSSRVKIAEV